MVLDSVCFPTNVNNNDGKNSKASKQSKTSGTTCASVRGSYMPIRFYPQQVNDIEESILELEDDNEP